MYAYPQFIASNYISASLTFCISEVVNRRRTEYTISGRKKGPKEKQSSTTNTQKTKIEQHEPTKIGGEHRCSGNPLFSWLKFEFEFDFFGV